MTPKEWAEQAIRRIYGTKESLPGDWAEETEDGTPGTGYVVEDIVRQAVEEQFQRRTYVILATYGYKQGSVLPLSETDPEKVKAKAQDIFDLNKERLRNLEITVFRGEMVPDMKWEQK